jgi:hypothetical protein
MRLVTLSFPGFWAHSVGDMDHAIPRALEFDRAGRARASTSSRAMATNRADNARDSIALDMRHTT